MKNNLENVIATMTTLERAGLTTWLFGGWAEECWGLAAPRPHGDLDLLLLANDFDGLDYWMIHNKDVCEIVAKRFSHKRAFEYRNLRVEVMLVQRVDGRCYTNFFGGKLTYQWPHNLLNQACQVLDFEVRLACPDALMQYRENHAKVMKLYDAHIAI